MMIVVGFDETVVTDRYPGIGNEVPFAVETLKLLQQEHHRLILWSVREDKLLDEAVAWYRERGVEFYAVNKEYPEQELQDDRFSGKLEADLFVDDRNMGGLFDWGIIHQMIKEYKMYWDIYVSGDDVLKEEKREWF